MSSRAESGSGAFGPQVLLEKLNREFPQPERYWLAFSGGLDSTVLLHALAEVRDRLRAPLAAIHIDHNLQAGSADWADHCRTQCDALDIPLTCLAVDAAAQAGESPEAAARSARYAAITEAAGPRSMLLTAQHRDDQAETLLLQLLRGAGVEGLAAMPAIREWNQGWHARPLLERSRAEIHAWATARQLVWIDDPSNAEIHADRNYLRHQVLPALNARWPGAVGSIARSATLCGEAAAAIRAQAVHDLHNLARSDGRSLPLAGLCALPGAEARILLRQWLRGRGAPALSHRRLQDALDQLCHARPDAAIRITWGDWELRRFRDQAWLVSGISARLPAQRLHWSGEELSLGPGLGCLRRRLAPGGIDRRCWREGLVEVGYRAAGLRCRLAGRSGSRTFKKIAQEYAVPPWLRERTPLIFIDGRLAAIANACVCEPFAAPSGEPGWLIDWFTD